MKFRKYIPSYRTDRLFMLLFVATYTFSKILESRGNDVASANIFDRYSGYLFIAWWIMTEAVIAEKDRTIKKLEGGDKYP